MATTYYFLEAPNQPSAALDWFRSLEACPNEYPKDRGVLLHFDGFGPLGADGNGGFDVARSPLVSVFPPAVRLGELWTVGEVHFLARANEFPALEAMRRRFGRWLSAHPKVFDGARPDDRYTYYLEGGIQSVASKIFALPSGLEAIQSGRYFVSDDANAHVLETLRKKLRLRGIELS